MCFKKLNMGKCKMDKDQMVKTATQSEKMRYR